MRWLEASFRLAWEPQSALGQLRATPRPVNLERVLMEKYSWSLLLLLPKGRPRWSKSQTFARMCQQTPASPGTTKGFGGPQSITRSAHHPWQQVGKLHIHFPALRADTSVYSHKAGWGGCRQLGARGAHSS